VKPAAFDYRAPRSVEEALSLLQAHAGEGAKLLAGGQSLVPVLNFRLAAPSLLIDLNRIAALAGIRAGGDGGLRLGAMTRNREIERSELVRTRNPLLHSAMPYIAHAQIRNRGTIGGSLAHADPAAELPAVCIACEADIVAVGRRGERSVRADEFFRGLFTTALEPDELLTEVRFPAWPARRRFAFDEVSRRHGDFAIVGVAVLYDAPAARVVVFGAQDAPRLFVFSGQAPADAGRAAAKDIAPRSDHHASADYRRELVEVLTRRALEKAMR
jgi:aerobic carbon-monoxide dehydrogenase medium subunit